MLLRLPTFCCILALSVVTARASQEWPQFRGPTGQGVSDATGVPVEWSSTKNVAWKADVPGRGWSSPVLSRGRVYLTTAVEKTKGSTTLHAMCLDEKTGDILWDTEVFKPEASLVGKMHEKNSPASPTPIVTEEKLYVHFGTLGTAALDLTGKVLWRQNDLKFSPVHGNGGSPILLNGELVFTCDGARRPLRRRARRQHRQHQVEDSPKHPGQTKLLLLHAAGYRSGRRDASDHSRQRVRRRL